MNERIKQLAKEAGYYLYDLTETHEIKTVETDSKDEWITLEKFAELIVKETMQVVANQLPSNQYLDVAHAVIEHYKDADVT